MKVKNTHFAALICALLLGSAALSQAAVLVSEDFSYGDGPLNGQNGGTGFSDAWSSSVNVAGGVVGGNSPSFRNFSTAFASSGILWVSFDWGHDSSTGSAYGGLTFYVGGTEKFLIGNTWDPSTWNMNGATPTSVSSVGIKTGVAKITLGAGATSTVELWVGAVGSPVDVSGPAMATATGRELEGVNRIRIMGNNDQKFDNLLIGTTMADVDAISYASTSGTWTNTVGGTWGTAGNWLESIVATGNGSTADFSTLTLVGDTTVQLGSPQTIGSLLFADVGSTYGWTLDNNGNSGNTLTLAGTTPTITVNALGDTKTVTISAVVVGTAGITKSGTGTLALSAANTYSGATTVGNGTLQVSGQRYFDVGRTTTVASNAVFELSNSDNSFTTLMPVSAVTGAGTFRLSGSSTIFQSENGVNGIKLTFAMQAGGLIDLKGTSRVTNGGWQLMGWTDNKASMNIDSGATFDIWDGQPVIIDALTGSGTFDKVHGGNSPSLLTVGVADGSGTFSGTIMNTGGQVALIKVGNGIQTLAGVNSYGGTTTVQDGTLRIDGNSSGALGALTVESGAFLGGHGSYGGNITLNEGAALNCDLTLTDSTLTCNGQLSFTNLDLADCTFTVAPGGGAFTLIEAGSQGTVTFAQAEGKINGVSSKLYMSGNKLMLMVGLGTRISFF